MTLVEPKIFVKQCEEIFNCKIFGEKIKIHNNVYHLMIVSLNLVFVSIQINLI